MVETWVKMFSPRHYDRLGRRDQALSKHLHFFKNKANEKVLSGHECGLFRPSVPGPRCSCGESACVMCQLRKGWYKNVDPGALALCVRVKNVMRTRRVLAETVTDLCACACDREAAAERRTAILRAD